MRWGKEKAVTRGIYSWAKTSVGYIANTHKHKGSHSSAALESSLDLKTKQTSASALCPPPPLLPMPSTTLFSICIWSFCCWLCAAAVPVPFLPLPLPLPLPWLLLLVNWIKVQMLAINITKKLMPHVCAVCGACVRLCLCLHVWLCGLWGNILPTAACGTMWNGSGNPFWALYNYNWDAVLTNRLRGMQQFKLVLVWCAP